MPLLTTLVRWTRDSLPPDARAPAHLSFLALNLLALLIAGCAAAFAWHQDAQAQLPWLFWGLAFLALNLLAWVQGLPLGMVHTGLNLGVLALLWQTCLLTGGWQSPVLILMGFVPALTLFVRGAGWAIAWWAALACGLGYLYLNPEPAAASDTLSALELQNPLAVWAGISFLQLWVLLAYQRLSVRIRKDLQDKNEALEQQCKQLMNADYHKDKFLATVSHEMRTPLNAVMGYLGLIETSGQLPEFVVNYVKGSRTAAAHLLTIINDLLDYSQIQQGQLVLTPQVVNLRTVLTEAHQTLIPKASAKRLDYTLQIDPSVPTWGNLDPNRFTQIVINLLGNAVKFTHLGRVVLRAWCQRDPDDEHQGTLFISVSDTGVGISKAAQAKIFEPFVQLDTQSIYEDNSLRGNGLGLAISHNLVKSFGGQIRLDSEEGVGSTFEVQIPLQIVHAVQPEAEEIRPAGEAYPDHFRILLVDDHATNRMVAAFTIKQSFPNALIDEARNGTEGMAKMEANPYDLVLMDLIMPDINGIEVVRHIRISCPPERANVPVIALTANVADDAVHACKAVGILQVLPKPFDREALVHAVYIHARRHHNLDLFTH